MASVDWLAELGAADEPIADSARIPSGDWRQDADMPVALWADTATQIAARVSIENLEQTYALHLLHGRVASTPEDLPLPREWRGSGGYHVGAEESAAPVRDGYLRRLRFWRSRSTPAQSVEAAQLVVDFMRAETVRIPDMERWLRERYGSKRPGDTVFQWIDYPAFDNGTMSLGFAILVHGPELHVWSRVVHAHK